MAWVPVSVGLFLADCLGLVINLWMPLLSMLWGQVMTKRVSLKHSTGLRVHAYTHTHKHTHTHGARQTLAPSPLRPILISPRQVCPWGASPVTPHPPTHQNQGGDALQEVAKKPEGVPHGPNWDLAPLRLKA